MSVSLALQCAPGFTLRQYGVPPNNSNPPSAQELIAAYTHSIAKCFIRNSHNEKLQAPIQHQARQLKARKFTQPTAQEVIAHAA
jgi:hypothetical protein